MLDTISRSFAHMHPERSDRMHCVVVDDHVMVAQMLCGMLRTLPGVGIVGTGSGLGDVARLAALRQVDVLIADAFLGNESGLPLLRAIRAAHAGLRCILLTDGRDVGMLPADVAESVVAIVDKSAPWEHLRSVVESMSGSTRRTREASASRDQLSSMLTARELEVFAAIGQGLSNKEVAELLAISVRTAETHRKAIAKKLGCNGAALVRLAVVARLTGLEQAPRRLAT